MSEGNDNTKPVDEESAKLLAEIEAQSASAKSSRKVVPQKAAKVEAPVAVAKVEAPAKAPLDDRLITNTSNNPRRIGGTTVPVGGTYLLTHADLEDGQMMAKIEHSVNLGVLSRGAD